MATPTTTVRRSRLIAAPVDSVFEAALSVPLPQLYRRRYGPMPPIVEVQDQLGAWETPGQTRVIVLADGGRMREELLSIDRPHRFRNRLTVLKGPFTSLVATVDESWSFRPVGTGTDATWEWNLVAKSAVARLLVPLVGRLWLGYAGVVLEQLSDEVLGTAEP
ncbi:MAG: SRPBCC family protein [Propionibacteriaceae bacterium]